MHVAELDSAMAQDLPLTVVVSRFYFKPHLM